MGDIDDREMDEAAVKGDGNGKDIARKIKIRTKEKRSVYDGNMEECKLEGECTDRKKNSK